jgi:nitroreductase
MEFIELEKFLKARRSIRKWQDKAVSQELLTKAIEIATWAPNAGNQQNWRFYVILNKETIQSMAQAVQTTADQIASWIEADNEPALAARWREMASFFRNAPALIGVAASQYQSPGDKVLASRVQTEAKAKQIRDWRNAVDSRVQSAAAAITYLLLIIHQMGLGSVWMTGPMQAKGELEKILKVPEKMDLVALLPVGYPAENPIPKERKPITEICEILK